FHHEAMSCHFLIYPTPEQIKRTERRKGQHQLATGFEMFHQSLNRLETVWPQEHHSKITGYTVKTGQFRRQRTHIQAFEPQPGEVHPLDRSRTLDLTPTKIYGHHLPSRSDLLCQIESWNSMAGGNVKNGGPRLEVQMEQQRLSEWGGPKIVG